ncbi:ABC transporter ATP-binding protein [Nesterenkonia ebinurensis]|uniref:ABC transporter ATP-binding protein n=1 Tax=Nesterenkonia ebinurensis TaxID=2608252 RepID=UPI00123CAD39|nr:ABC transporter ATP-binding protein [Nesterenkonia ebinurensis]
MTHTTTTDTPTVSTDPAQPQADVPTAGPRLQVQDATIGYDKRSISHDLSVQIPDESFTVIIGPNACGKSTLLRALSRLLKPSSGQVILDGQTITAYKSKEVARKVGLLPQTSVAPDGITVADLVARGRFPHQSFIKQWSRDDETAVYQAMEATGITELSHRLVDELSGGQRQRVWVSVALAQQTEILLLDEPTTFLDITHQIELLELFTDLHQQGHTLVAVLHDLNHAARYATYMIAMRHGDIITQGTPEHVVTQETIKQVFDLDCRVVPDPVAGTPQVVPLGRDRSRRTTEKTPGRQERQV